MATLNREESRERIKKRAIAIGILTIVIVILLPLFANTLCYVLYSATGKGNVITSLSYFTAINNVIRLKQVREAAIFIILGYVIFMIYNHKPIQKIEETKTIKITDEITIPMEVGNGQYGNAKFMNEEEKKEIFDVFDYKGKSSFKNLKSGGIIIHNEQIGNHDIYYYIGGTYHTILLGPTRSGKGQRVILKSIWLSLSAGENGLVIDPKGENYHFTREYAKKTDHDVYVLDFRNPNKGMHYNYMSEINNYIDSGDVVNATDKTWDLVSVLVGEPKGERIWNDGECSVIAASILIVSCDAPQEYRNFTNVYSFIAYMCERDEDGVALIELYMRDLEDNHPAKLVYQVAKVAPYRTRGSFFTSALATLRLFTNWNVAEMTSKSDFDLEEVINKKSIIYLIIPDEKETLYPLVMLFIKIHYMKMLDIAANRGNELPIIHENFYDEFGNMPKMPGMGSMMSAGAGRGIKNLLVLQDYEQLEKKYEKDAKNIKSNAEVKILLKTSDERTKEEFSKASGKYTVQVASAGVSLNESSSRADVSSNSNVSMVGRNLLDQNEVGLIKEPYALVYKTGERMAITRLPNMKGSQAEKDLELGDKEFNRKLIERQEQERESRKVLSPKLWDIWKNYQNNQEQQEQTSNERISFL